MARSSRTPDIDNFNGTNISGSYQFTDLNQIINTFIVSYIGKDKVLTNVPRHEVAFWAQRAVQEFSYDVLYSEKSVEIEMSEVGVAFLPNDYINYVRITLTDANGNLRPILPSVGSFAATRAALQDENYEYVYDNNGDQLYADDSETIKSFQDPQYRRDTALNYYDGYFFDEDFSYYYRSYYGKRYGSDPRRFHRNATYVLDNASGKIYFDNNIQTDDIVTLFYISDGLADGGDLSNVRVPKLAEDAMYASILYNISKLRPDAAPLAQLYKREAYAKLRNTKIRLSNFKLSEFGQLMREKSKWIKH